MTEVAQSASKAAYTLKAVLRVCLVAVFIFLGLANVLDVVSTTVDRFDGQLEDHKPEDLLSFYTAGRFVLDGRSGDIYNPDAMEQYQEALVGREVGGHEQGLPFFNPPYVAGLLAPLTAFSLPAFSAVFFGVVLLSTIAGGLLAQRFLPPMTTGQRILLWFGFLTFLPVAWMLEQQQLTMFVFLGWAGFIWLESRGEHRWSGAALALALVKPQSVLLLLIILVWKRRWLTLRSFALAAAPLVLLSIIVSGPQALIEYPRFIMESTQWEGRGVNALGMFSWNGLSANLLRDSAPPLLSYLPMTLLTLGGLFMVWRDAEWQAGSGRFLLLCSVTLLSVVLINPHFYLQDVTLICIPLVLLAAWQTRQGAGLTRWWWLAAVTWIVGMYGPQLQQNFGITLLTPWIVALLLLSYYRLRKPAAEPALSQPALAEAQAA